MDCLSRRVPLRPRLRAIADRVPFGARLTDVGSDHAYLPIALLLEGRISGAVAADISAPCVRRAAENGEKWGVSQRLCARLGDGLQAVSPEEAQVIVIAGMGGETIGGILEAAPWAMDGRLLLLQPVSHPAALRKWLYAHHADIREEWITADARRLYTAMAVRGSAAPQKTDALYELASEALLSRNDGETARYLRGVTAGLRRKLAGQRSAGHPAAAQTEELLERWMKRLEERLEERQ